MLLLFETAAGYALFKVLKEGKLQEAEVRTATVRLGCEHLSASSTLVEQLHIACLYWSRRVYEEQQSSMWRD